jgi:hypothetical protein
VRTFPSLILTNIHVEYFEKLALDSPHINHRCGSVTLVIYLCSALMAQKIADFPKPPQHFKVFHPFQYENRVRQCDSFSAYPDHQERDDTSHQSLQRTHILWPMCYLKFQPSAVYEQRFNSESSQRSFHRMSVIPCNVLTQTLDDRQPPRTKERYKGCC